MSVAVGRVRWLVRPLWPRGLGGAGPPGRRAHPSPPRHCLRGIRWRVGEDTQRFHIIPVARETIFLLSGHVPSSLDQLEAQHNPFCDFSKENKQKGEMLTKKSRIQH